MALKKPTRKKKTPPKEPEVQVVTKRLHKLTPAQLKKVGQELRNTQMSEKDKQLACGALADALNLTNKEREVLFESVQPPTEV